MLFLSTHNKTQITKYLIVNICHNGHIPVFMCVSVVVFVLSEVKCEFWGGKDE